MDEQRYNDYLRYCENLGVKPARFERWHNDIDYLWTPWGLSAKGNKRSAKAEKKYPRPH